MNLLEKRAIVDEMIRCQEKPCPDGMCQVLSIGKKPNKKF
jgi:hypothetical protein